MAVKQIPVYYGPEENRHKAASIADGDVIDSKYIHISTEDGNIIESTDNGLYAPGVDPSELISSDDDNALVLGNDGNLFVPDSTLVDFPDVEASATTLPPGSEATATADYDAIAKRITYSFGIPQGVDGQDGQPGQDLIEQYIPTSSEVDLNDLTQEPYRLYLTGGAINTPEDFSGPGFFENGIVVSSEPVIQKLFTEDNAWHRTYVPEEIFWTGTNSVLQVHGTVDGVESTANISIVINEDNTGSASIINQSGTSATFSTSISYIGEVESDFPDMPANGRAQRYRLGITYGSGAYTDAVEYGISTDLASYAFFDTRNVPQITGEQLELSLAMSSALEQQLVTSSVNMDSWQYIDSATQTQVVAVFYLDVAVSGSAYSFGPWVSHQGGGNDLTYLDLKDTPDTYGREEGSSLYGLVCAPSTANNKITHSDIFTWYKSAQLTSASGTSGTRVSITLPRHNISQSAANNRRALLHVIPEEGVGTFNISTSGSYINTVKETHIFIVNLSSTDTVLTISGGTWIGEPLAAIPANSNILLRLTLYAFAQIYNGGRVGCIVEQLYPAPQAGGGADFTATAETVSYLMPASVQLEDGQFTFNIPQGFPGLPGPTGRDAVEKVYNSTSGMVDSNTFLQGPAYYFVEEGSTLVNFPDGVTTPLYLQVENNDTNSSVKQTITSAEGEATRIGTTQDNGWADGVGELPVYLTSPNSAATEYEGGYIRFRYTNSSDTLALSWHSYTVYLNGTTIDYTRVVDEPSGPTVGGRFNIKINYELLPGSIIQIVDTIVFEYDGTDGTIVTGTIARDDYTIEITGGTVVKEDDGSHSISIWFTGIYQRAALATTTMSAWIFAGRQSTETFLLTESGTFTPTRSGIARIRCVGGGGAGGYVAVQTNAVTIGASGGSSGGVVERTVYLVEGQEYSYTIGAGGISNGTAAGATTFTISSTDTVTAVGGLPGYSGNGSGSADSLYLYRVQAAPPGGTPGSVSPINEVIITAETGSIARIRAFSGSGGSSPFGTGGTAVAPANNTGSNGNPATGYGGGGSGACVNTSTTTQAYLGGAGTAGCIEIVMIYN